ncbi:hypothetical protein Tco_0044849 [Tanacetum coccineum]
MTRNIERRQSKISEEMQIEKDIKSKSKICLNQKSCDTRNSGDMYEDYCTIAACKLAGAAEDHGDGLRIPADPNTHLLIPDTEIPQSQGPTFTHVADKAITTGVRVGTEGATTTTSGLDARVGTVVTLLEVLRTFCNKGIDGPCTLRWLPGLLKFEKRAASEKDYLGKVVEKVVLSLVERSEVMEVAFDEKEKTKRKWLSLGLREAGLTEAMRLQSLQEEEAARQVHLDALLAKRISREGKNYQNNKRKEKMKFKKLLNFIQKRIGIPSEQNLKQMQN